MPLKKNITKENGVGGARLDSEERGLRGGVLGSNALPIRPHLVTGQLRVAVHIHHVKGPEEAHHPMLYRFAPVLAVPSKRKAAVQHVFLFFNTRFTAALRFGWETPPGSLGKHLQVPYVDYPVFASSRSPATQPSSCRCRSCTSKGT